MADTLQQIIDEIELHPLPSGTGFWVTLFLPWGAAVGEIVPAWFFDQKVAGQLRVVGAADGREDGLDALADKITPKEGETAAHASDEYVHLGEFTDCHVNGQVYRHHWLRVRLTDVTAWTYGPPAVPVR
jgi:hypothetical protein